MPCHRTVHRTGIDIGKSKPLCQSEGNTALTRSSGTIDGNDVMRRHAVCASSSLEIAGKQARVSFPKLSDRINEQDARWPHSQDGCATCHSAGASESE